MKFSLTIAFALVISLLQAQEGAIYAYGITGINYTQIGDRLNGSGSIVGFGMQVHPTVKNDSITPKWFTKWEWSLKEFGRNEETLGFWNLKGGLGFQGDRLYIGAMLGVMSARARKSSSALTAELDVNVAFPWKVMGGEIMLNASVGKYLKPVYLDDAALRPNYVNIGLAWRKKIG